MNKKWLFVRDSTPSGHNFIKSKHPFWATKRHGESNIIKILESLKEGEKMMLCFVGNGKNKTQYVLGFATYVSHKYTLNMDPTEKESFEIACKEQEWIPASKSDLKIDYTNKIICDTNHSQLSVIIDKLPGGNLVSYDLHHEKIRLGGDLHEYYESFQEPSEEDKLEERKKEIQRRKERIQEDEAKLQEDEAKLQEENFKKWVLSDESYQYFLKAYEQCINIEKSDTLCLIPKPTKEMWNNLSDDKKRILYAQYLKTMDSQ
jgi:hypothetical protein